MPALRHSPPPARSRSLVAALTLGLAGCGPRQAPIEGPLDGAVAESGTTDAKVPGDAGSSLICGSEEEVAARAAPNQELCQPETVWVDDESDVLDVQLDVTYRKTSLPLVDGNDVTWYDSCMRGYDNPDSSAAPVPFGPTLRLRANNTLTAHMAVKLPMTMESMPSTASGHGSGGEHDPNVPHGFNVTNLHTHGLHVSPAGNADNVLVSLYPGDRFTNEIHLPERHLPGTHWYHAHRHGSVAMQVASGMAGALIVDGDLDERLAEVYGDSLVERVMLMQQPSFGIRSAADPTACNNTDGVDVAKTECGYEDAAEVACLENFGQVSAGPATTVNGQYQPTLTLEGGQVARLRLLHAGINNTITVRVAGPLTPEKIAEVEAAVARGENPSDSIVLDDLPLHVIAEDGITYPEPVAYEGGFIMHTGYRADVLVRPEEPGVYLVIDGETLAEDAMSEPDGTLKPELLGVIARIVVKGQVGELPSWPPTAALLDGTGHPEPITDAELWPQDPCLGLEYGFSNDKGGFLINDSPYDPAAPPSRSPTQVDEEGRAYAQEWQLTSTAGNHPHHIHTNPFRIENPSPRVRQGPVWKDTWLVEQDDTEEEPTRARTRYETYIGRFVLHCHILTHEDQGMMQEVELQLHPPAARASVAEPATDNLAVRAAAASKYPYCAIPEAD